ncbi:hypothetical protein BDR04DRAFT_666355 [Suillus decipiens]|nr:hypothetical protein BDR04DRAFT_666355 [Suillus decipiens]
MRSMTSSNQTSYGLSPFSSNSTRLQTPGFPPPSPPSMFSRVSADSSTVQTPSISVTKAAAHTPPHTTPVGRPSPPDDIEMRPLVVNMEVANDEPPPANTQIRITYCATILCDTCIGFILGRFFFADSLAAFPVYSLGHVASHPAQISYEVTAVPALFTMFTKLLRSTLEVSIGRSGIVPDIRAPY